MSRSFVPPYLLERVAAAENPDVASCGRRTLRLDAAFRSARAAAGAPPTTATGVAWQVFTAGNTLVLPGELARVAGEPPTADPAVDEAADGIEATLALLREWHRTSYDGRGATVAPTVHYGQDYDNAFWDGERLVFGDGDGRVFERFTKPVDVVAHELGHAVVQHTAGLVYADQPGALNESLCDVIGACVKQRLLGQQAHDADWLVGEGIFVPGVQGRALRSMAQPGTAYDDPVLGRDPQVGTMEDYVVTSADNGGVHLNSAIPNRAFHLAATGIGGESWAGAGLVWYAALTSGLAAEAGFAEFARACVGAAGEHADVVRAAWTEVGVLDGAGPVLPAPAAPTAGVVRVRRSGGFTGLLREAEIDLAGTDDLAVGLRAVLARVDLRRLGATPPRPDRFVYEIDCPPDVSVVLGEPDLPPDLAEVLRRALDG